VPAAFWECCPIACACHAKQNPGPPKVQNLFHLPRETYIAEKREFARPEWREARSSRCELSINPGPYTYSKSPAVDSMFEEKLAKAYKSARARHVTLMQSLHAVFELQETCFAPPLQNMFSLTKSFDWKPHASSPENLQTLRHVRPKLDQQLRLCCEPLPIGTLK